MLATVKQGVCPPRNSDIVLHEQQEALMEQRGPLASLLTAELRVELRVELQSEAYLWALWQAAVPHIMS